jgi:ion channel-forming bestrophin family protein
MIAYNPHDWATHLFDVRGSMFREIIGRVSTCVAWSAVIVLIHRHVYPLDVPSTVHGYVGIALSLLLVFRTNASYDRFWDGRRQWGSIINETRNLARAVSVHLKARPDLRDQVLRWADAFAYATRARGRRG